MKLNTPRKVAMSRPKVPKPSHQQILELAHLADVEPRVAERALIYGVGAIIGDDWNRVVIAMYCMRLDFFE